MAKAAVTLSQDRLKELLHYDPETGVFTWPPGTGGKGRPHHPKRAGGDDGQGYYRIWVEGRFYRSTHIAWLYMTGELPSAQIDHADKNSLNDRWNNLRLATQNQNKANSGAYKNNSLGVKGVRLHRNGHNEALLRFNGKLVYLGCYRTLAEAKAVYDAAAIEHFGEFARSA